MMSEQLPPQPKPTLHEIAAMPFPASQEAMRKHYNPDWHKELPEGKKMFRVSVDWTIEGSFVEDIEAEDEDEAKELAREYALEDAGNQDYIDVTILSIKELAA